MSKLKNKGLGRGLDAIFLDNSSESQSANTMLRISDIEPSANQPRKVFDGEALAQLADSIAMHGMIQPVVVRENPEGFYTIVAGERRWRAAKLAGLVEIPVVILDIDDNKAAELALVENIQREDLNPIEEANAYKTLITEYNLTQEELSKKMGRSRSAIANSIRLLDLPDALMGMVANDDLSSGHARTLLGLKNTSDIEKVAQLVIKRGLTVRETENLVKKLNRESQTPAVEEVPLVNYRAELERRMTQSLGRRITIKETGKTKKLEIEYTDNDDLETLIKKLCGDNIFDNN